MREAVQTPSAAQDLRQLRRHSALRVSLVVDEPPTLLLSPAHSRVRARVAALRNPAPPGNLLIDLAGAAYAVTMHIFAFRDPLASGSGVQGMIDIGGIVLAFCLVVGACWRQPRQFAPSPGTLCFIVFALFALCSSWRSYNPVLSGSKAGLLLLVLGTIYVACQAGQGTRFLLAVYRSYLGLVLLGLVAGVLMPGTYPLWLIDEYTGRARLSVWDTHAGMFGEDLELLVLVAPLLRGRAGWLSQSFLVVMNLLSGGKTTSALLALLLLARFARTLRTWRSWPMLAAVAATAAVLAVVALSLISAGPHTQAFSHSAQNLYGTHVDQDATSLDGRLALWQASFALLPTAVGLGYGFAGVREIMLSVAAWAGNSHNGYLEMALSSGLVGFAALLLGVALTIKASWRAPSLRRFYLLSIIFSILVTDCIGATFSTPSFLGCMLLVWVGYEARSIE